MFVIIYKDGHQEHTYDEHDIFSLDWSDIVMVINLSNVEQF